MPTYQYACTECGHQLEAVQSFTDESLTVCPECQGLLRKQFSAVGVVFKGSGFYRTDSRSSSSKSPNGSSSSAKTETKTETKSESTTSTTTKPAASSTPAA
ncbi:FmdB family zinc ribbon protein [Dactylosporangium salmoneum]|uniref:Putative regulatory protein FmdB zinc ribbon domain-containing protein n=1 Tax=Dactylosporangium salmoneum TaxID=53361 RepID=A0ABP5UCR4_9ACTN